MKLSNNEKVLQLITEIRNSNPVMEDIFLYGSCCNFHYILKAVFPQARALFNICHVITYIDGMYYDITGQINVVDVINGGYTSCFHSNPFKYKHTHIYVQVHAHMHQHTTHHPLTSALCA